MRYDAKRILVVARLAVWARWGAALAAVALLAPRASADLIPALVSVPARDARLGVYAPRMNYGLDVCLHFTSHSSELFDTLGNYAYYGGQSSRGMAGLDLQFKPQPKGAIQGNLIPLEVRELGPVAFQYKNNLRQRSPEFADAGIVTGQGPFLVTYDGLRPRLHTFDGSSYQGLYLTFQQQRLEPPVASMLYDIETGGQLITSVAAVAPQAVATTAQGSATQATLGGGLLCLCLLGRRRRSGPSLGTEFVPSDAFNLPAPVAVADTRAAAVPRTIMAGGIYDRVVKVENWSGASPAASTAFQGPRKACDQGAVGGYGQNNAFSVPQFLCLFRLRGNTAMLSHAAHLSLLLMRRSGAL